jgi:hypothetical protein
VGNLLDELDAIAGAGGTIDELARRAESALADPAVVAAEIREPEALFSGAERRWDALVERTRQAWLRYRGGSGRPLGSHGEAPDARAPELFATPTYLEKAGIYRPSELRERAAVDEPWAAREALRLSMILLAVEALIARLDDGSIEPAAWSGAIEQIVRRFGRMTIAR